MSLTTLTRPGRIEPLSDQEREERAQASAASSTVTKINKPTKAALKRQGVSRADNIRVLLQSMTVQFETVAVQLAEVKYDPTAWKAMGYKTFAEYISSEYGEHLAQLNAALRKAIVASKVIKDAGLTQPELAALTGASERTVRRDNAHQNGRESGQVAAKPTSPVGKDGLVILEDNHDDGSMPDAPLLDRVPGPVDGKYIAREKEMLTLLIWQPELTDTQREDLVAYLTECIDTLNANMEAK